MTPLLLNVLLWLALAQPPAAAPPSFALGAPTPVATGVLLYRPAASGLLDPQGPLAVQALQVDPAHARLAIALAGDGTPARQPVATIAEQHGALAAINASFFDRLGRQVGLIKVNGEVVARAGRPRGAVAWSPAGLVFDRVRMRLRLRIAGRGDEPLLIDHVNPAASRSGLSVYTASFRLPVWGRTPPPAAVTGPPPPPSQPGAPTLPASDDESEAGKPAHKTVRRWVLAGEPLRVTEVLKNDDRQARSSASPTSPSRAILAYRSQEATLPAALRDLARGRRVALVEEFDTAAGSAASPAWAQALFAVGGAGLLVQDGRLLTDWTPEDLRAGFATERHPRTMIGTDATGRVWLVTVDGRRPETSVGMSFTELQRLAQALGLVNALNLDGGGSTTMVVAGRIVNQPTDLIGPRAVPDAIVVLAREKGVGKSFYEKRK